MIIQFPVGQSASIGQFLQTIDPELLLINPLLLPVAAAVSLLLLVSIVDADDPAVVADDSTAVVIATIDSEV